MKVRSFGLGAIALVAMICGNAAAAGQPGQETLQAMGLGGMIVMNDASAMNVRGFGYSGHKKSSKSSARAYGSSFAKVSGHGAQAGSVNGYDSKGKNFAAGANISVAGIEIETGGGHGGGGGGPAMSSKGKGGHGGGGYGGKPSVKSVKVFAGGGSIAIAD
jgi:hypothetical protein